MKKYKVEKIKVGTQKKNYEKNKMEKQIKIK